MSLGRESFLRARLDFLQDLPRLLCTKQENTFPADTPAASLEDKLLSSLAETSYLAEKKDHLES